ncbi:hypothetical protein J2S43_000657 [Catenuloplanes nepalensis]|uniref:Uncharacterized protein n=1 Tax=Catenuloplanes nepalensis TaxID=587533 RepID=A0ABT9ML48_9ACTN|nr:hypothetical protein [Catenuloplanes nepalensis]
MTEAKRNRLTVATAVRAGRQQAGDAIGSAGRPRR